MNSTSLSYIALVGALSAASCAGAISVMGVNPFGALVVMFLFVLLGAGAAAWETYRWRRPGRKWLVYGRMVDGELAGQYEPSKFDHFGPAMNLFSEMVGSDDYRWVSVSAPDGSAYTWNHPNYSNPTSMGPACKPLFEGATSSDADAGDSRTGGK